MNVTEALRRRMSVRAFTAQPVAPDTIRHLLDTAARSPSGGNLQPWHVHVVGGEALKELRSIVDGKGPDAMPGYAIYPENLTEPFRTRRYQSGEDLYATIGIPREDKAGRIQQLMRNAAFFGAPVGLFILVDRCMGPPQWADLGIYIQSLMLLAVEAGLDTCPQEFWAIYASTVERFLGAPESQMLFCGIALGHRDETAPINGLRTTRAPFDEWCTMHGFDDASSPN